MDFQIKRNKKKYMLSNLKMMLSVVFISSARLVLLFRRRHEGTMSIDDKIDDFCNDDIMMSVSWNNGYFR